MEHSFDILTKEKESIQTEIDYCETLIKTHYKHIERIKKDQISYEIKKREVNQAIDLIKYHNKIM